MKTNIGKMKIIPALLLCAALTAGALAGCANTGTTAAPSTDAAQTAAAETNASAENEESGRFTARDSDGSYDEASAVTITLSDGGSAADGPGVSVNGDTVTVTAGGTYLLRGSLSNGQILIDADKEEKLRLVLDGVSVSNASSAALYIRSADKVFLTLAEGGENTLSNTGAFVAADENNVDGCIYSKEDLTVNGSGALFVSSEQGHGIVSKDSLVITGGEITVTAAKHGLQGKDDVSVSGGVLNITCGRDGIHSENSDDDDLGNVLIEGGEITISAGDDGVHAGNSVTVNAGTVSVKNSYEGIEGKEVNLNGGVIDVNASDDGVNAAGGADGSGFGAFSDRFNGSADAAIRITGGEITVNADGDGLDANGALEVSGGTVYVSGPVNNGNGALDYDTAGTISGGVVIAAGSAGMAVNFGSTSTQCSFLVSVQGGAGDEITVTDGSGAVIARYTPEKAYQTVVVSAPELKVGETYTVSAGSQSTSVTLTGTITGGGSGMGGPGRGGMR